MDQITKFVYDYLSYNRAISVFVEVPLILDQQQFWNFVSNLNQRFCLNRNFHIFYMMRIFHFVYIIISMYIIIWDIGEIRIYRGTKGIVGENCIFNVGET